MSLPTIIYALPKTVIGNHQKGNETDKEEAGFMTVESET